jgi:hypothetical protein
MSFCCRIVAWRTTRRSRTQTSGFDVPTLTDSAIYDLSKDCGIRIPLKTKVNLSYIYIFSPYRAVNTHRLGYKNPSVNAV